MVGGIPSTESVTEIVNFESGRTYCEEIDNKAWGYIEYATPLDPQQASDYELVLAPQKPSIPKPSLNRQKLFEDENLVAYTMGDRAYIKFVMKPRQQLIVALKSRKWWWNSNEEAWSTYLDKLDKEWVQSISTRYADYV